MTRRLSIPGMPIGRGCGHESLDPHCGDAADSAKPVGSLQALVPCLGLAISA